MDPTAPIISGHSLGGIVLGTHVDPVLAEAYAEGRQVEFIVYTHGDKVQHTYRIDGGTVTVNANAQGAIVSLSCQPPYQGTYEGKLWPGMSVAQIKAVTQKQMLIFSVLVLDNEWGVCFELPPPYDEYDYIDEMPDDFILNKLFVRLKNWRGY